MINPFRFILEVKQESFKVAWPTGKETLTGAAGSVYFWTSNTIHGTSPEISKDDNFRISLRYIIEKKPTSKGLIDKIIHENKVGKTRKK